MSAWQAVLDEARDEWTLAALVAIVLIALLIRVAAPGEGERLRAALVWFGLHLAMLPVAGTLRVGALGPYAEVRLASLAFEMFAVISVGARLLFAVLLPRAGVHAPRILRDVLVAGVSLVAFFALASRAGLNLSGLIATSTVLTAVIGLSLQDTLGNVMAGLALQFDQSIEVGDWIKLRDMSGRVCEIGWRSTSVETRNWETLVIPNSTLVRNDFLVLGRRSGKPLLWRRWVYFNVDFRFHPGDVLDAVTEAVRAAPIANVALEPAPQSVLMDFQESFGRYAVRYWLMDIAADDPTDSAVRTRVYFALQRAGIPLSIPAHAVFMTEDSSERRAQKTRQDTDHRRDALAHVELFGHLSDHDRDRLTASLRYAPFCRGEVMTRQGAVAHWLYLIIEGTASVRISVGGQIEREVAQLTAGSFFGEMSLMTGEPRSATVVALTNVECYRLDKAAFQEIIHERPELAEGIADVLAKRRVKLEATREDLDAEALRQRLASAKHDLLGSIRDFFGLAAHTA